MVIVKIMSYSTRFLIVLSVLYILFKDSLAMVNFNVVEMGANPDGKTDSTPAFLRAWEAACSSPESATIHVPQGTFLLHETQFNGPCKNGYISIQIHGSTTIVAPSDYRVFKKVKRWITFEAVNAVSIRGGVLDGKGTGLWKCKATSHGCPHGARTLTIKKSSNVNITGLTSKNCQLFHIVLHSSQNVRMEGITVSAPQKSPNTDGIHLQRSESVWILGSNIGTGDDCISIGQGTRNVWIENINCGPGHGISIGSLCKKYNEEGVENITAKSVVLANTQNGVRIKTWGRPCKTFVRGIVYQNVTVDNAKRPIVIDQNYCPRHKDCPNKASGAKISDIRYLDIHGTSATKVAVKLDCSPKHRCTDISLIDINLTYKNRPAQAWCENASGKTSGSLIHFVVVINRQGKVRLTKWYSTFSSKEKSKIIRDLNGMILDREPELCQFVEWKGLTIVYKRYAGLYVCMCVGQDENELETFDIIHRYVVLLDCYFGNVCELDLVFNYHKVNLMQVEKLMAYYILDELIVAGELQEPCKRTVLQQVVAQDVMVAVAREEASTHFMSNLEQ